jgi:hypothetical protein
MEVKEAPTRGLRAVFAGFGRALGGRRKGGTAATATAGGDSGNVKVVTPETAVPETVTPEAEPQAAVAETTAAETAVPQTVTPETVTPEAEPQAVVAETVTPETEPADAALPMANYDTLTVASLRARLRTLTVPQLKVLVEYEKAHQGREEVTGMFERRIAKIVAGETTGFPAIS